MQNRVSNVERFSFFSWIHDAKERGSPAIRRRVPRKRFFLSLCLSSFFPNPAFLFRDSNYLESWGHILCFVWYTGCTTLEMFVSFLSRVRTFLDFLCSHRLRLSSHPFRTRRLTHINSCIHTTLIEQTSYTLHSHTKFKDTTLEYDGTASHTTLSYTTGRVCTWCAS